LIPRKLIVLSIGRTAGVRWELEQIRLSGFMSKLVLLFPPVSQDDLANRWMQWRGGPASEVTGGVDGSDER